MSTTTQDPAAKAAAEIEKHAFVAPLAMEWKPIPKRKLTAIIRREHEPFMRLLERALDLLGKCRRNPYRTDWDNEAEILFADAIKLGVIKDQL